MPHTVLIFGSKPSNNAFQTNWRLIFNDEIDVWRFWRFKNMIQHIISTMFIWIQIFSHKQTRVVLFAYVWRTMMEGLLPALGKFLCISFIFDFFRRDTNYVDSWVQTDIAADTTLPSHKEFLKSLHDSSMTGIFLDFLFVVQWCFCQIGRQRLAFSSTSTRRKVISLIPQGLL